MDKKTQNAWVGHPHFYVLDNSTSFEGKLTRMIDIISKIVGLPSNLKRRSAKFLLKSPPKLENLEIDYQMFNVEKVYLYSNNQDPAEYRFARERTSLDANGKKLGSVYQLTIAKKVEDELVEQKRIIAKREYHQIVSQRDPPRHIIHQKRISFLYKHQSFVIHMYKNPARDLCILHAQVEGKDVDLPPFLDVERRIFNTPEDEKKYGAYSLSLINS